MLKHGCVIIMLISMFVKKQLQYTFLVQVVVERKLMAKLYQWKMRNKINIIHICLITGYLLSGLTWKWLVSM